MHFIKMCFYGRVPDGQRVDFHHRIAEREEAAYGERAGEIAAELANHYRRPNDAQKAARYFRLAGERAVERRAYREAEQHYRASLAMVLALPASSERDEQELKVLLALGRILFATQGWSATDTTELYERARTLVARSSPDERLEVLNGLWSTTGARGETRASQVFASEMLEIAQGINQPLALCNAHFVEGMNRHLLGDLTAARSHFLQAIEHYREQDSRDVPDDRGVTALVYAGMNEWLLGYPERGQRHIEDARIRARRFNNPFALAYVGTLGAWSYVLGRNFEAARSASTEAEGLGMELGLPVFSAVARIVGGWARACLGEVSGAVASIRAGLAELDARKWYFGRPFLVSLLGETQAHLGAADDAIATVEQALKSHSQEQWYRPLTIRLHGELRLQNTTDAIRFDLSEKDFRDAIELSRKMNAKSSELRASTSLARLLRDTGRRDEACAILSEIYNWFTEGFDTADLKDAKALLEELSA
jgi:adenylate cyclase